MLAVGGSYLQLIATGARLEAAAAQFDPLMLPSTKAGLTRDLALRVLYDQQTRLRSEVKDLRQKQEKAKEQQSEDEAEDKKEAGDNDQKQDGRKKNGKEDDKKQNDKESGEKRRRKRICQLRIVQ